jgi:hypothetical protein
MNKDQEKALIHLKTQLEQSWSSLPIEICEAWETFENVTPNSDLRDNLRGEVTIHGVNCEKKPHSRSGYLHGEKDDSPYMVDGWPYCGRCHTSLLKDSENK